MFNKIMKRGHKKPSKSEAVETPMPTSSPLDVTVNHASRVAAAAPTPQPAHTSPVPQNPGVVEVLPMVKEVPVAERHNIFIRKVHVCRLQFDFTELMKSVREKEIKRQTIAELIDLIHSGSLKLNEIMQEEMVSMISLNIFRPLPLTANENAESEGRDPEEDEVFMDPSWPHLQLIYELLLKYVVSHETDIKIAKRYINHTFVKKLLDLCDTEDPREREYLKIIVHRVYARFMIHRPFIRSSINNILYRYMFETERHNGIIDFIEILASIITGLVVPLKEEHKLFLVRVIIPLHKTKHVTSYHLQLSACVTQFVEKDYRLADIVIRGILKYWPIINCGKEVLFLGELEEILELTQPLEFQRCMVLLFKQLARCINSPHFQVAERALFMWNNENIIGFITENRHAILPIIFPALEKNVKSHWNQAINGLSSNVRKMFLEMDAELFEECQRRYEEKEAKANEVEEQRRETWKKLEAVAAANQKNANKFNKKYGKRITYKKSL